MTPTIIFRDYLLVGKEVTLELANKDAAIYILRLLRTAKSRHSADMKALGMEDDDHLKDQTVIMETVSMTDDSITVKFYTGVSEQKNIKVPFKIVGVSDGKS